MSYIIGKSCVDCMDTACASVCPVDCIHGPIDIEGSGGEIERDAVINLRLAGCSAIYSAHWHFAGYQQK